MVLKFSKLKRDLEKFLYKDKQDNILDLIKDAYFYLSENIYFFCDTPRIMQTKLLLSKLQKMIRQKGPLAKVIAALVCRSLDNEFLYVLGKKLESPISKVSKRKKLEILQMLRQKGIEFSHADVLAAINIYPILGYIIEQIIGIALCHFPSYRLRLTQGTWKGLVLQVRYIPDEEGIDNLREEFKKFYTKVRRLPPFSCSYILDLDFIPWSLGLKRKEEDGRVETPSVRTKDSKMQ